MGDIKKKMSAYFLMHEKEPNTDSFLRMAYELYMLGFDDDMFQRVMVLTPKQMASFLSSIVRSGLALPTHSNFNQWIFAGFMIRTLYGEIE